MYAARLRLAVVFTLLLAAAGISPHAVAAPVNNQAPGTSAAMVARNGGGSEVYYALRGGAVVSRTVVGGVWSATTAFGGVLIGAPAATRVGNDVVVVGRGGDSALWWMRRTNGVWSAWQTLGGVLSAAPAVTGSADGRIDVFARGTNNQTFTRTLRPGAAWTPWSTVEGYAVTGPAAVATSSGRIELMTIGGDNAVWRRTLGTTGWSAWTSLSGRTYSPPAVTYDAAVGRLLVLVRGTDHALYSRELAGGWQRRAGVLIDGPGAAVVAANQVQIVVRGTDTAFHTQSFVSGAWSGFTRAWMPAAPDPPASWMLGTDWTRIPTNSRVIALTFDAGANSSGLPSILATLQTKNVPATFYLTGSFARSFPAQSNEIAVAGFVLGNHSDTHPDFTTLTDAQVTSQILIAADAIRRANGGEVRPLFRFPFGAVNSRVLADVNRLGYVAVRWTVDSLGWKGTSGGMTTQSVANRVVSAATPGGIVLMHVGSNPADGTTLDAAALPGIIDRLRAAGYSFVTLRALTGTPS